MDESGKQREGNRQARAHGPLSIAHGGRAVVLRKSTLLQAGPIERQTHQVSNGFPLPVDPRHDGSLPREIHDESGLEPERAAAVADKLVRAEPEYSPPQDLVRSWTLTRASDGRHPRERGFQRTVRVDHRRSELQQVCSRRIDAAGRIDHSPRPWLDGQLFAVITGRASRTLLGAEGDRRAAHAERLENPPLQQVLVTDTRSQRQRMSQESETDIRILVRRAWIPIEPVTSEERI